MCRPASSAISRAAATASTVNCCCQVAALTGCSAPPSRSASAAAKLSATQPVALFTRMCKQPPDGEDREVTVARVDMKLRTRYRLSTERGVLERGRGVGIPLAGASAGAGVSGRARAWDLCLYLVCPRPDRMGADLERGNGVARIGQ